VQKTKLKKRFVQLFYKGTVSVKEVIIFAAMKYFRLLFITCLLLAFFVQEANAQRQRFIEKRKEIIKNDTNNYFYKNYNYGVQDLYNPAYVIVNGGYDILQLQGYNREVFKFNWRLNTRNVINNLTNPFPTISEIGWGRFTRTEIFPLNFTPNGSQWIPNYFLHFLGSGMEYRMMTEWYRYHNVPVPKLFSTLTILSAQFVNEVIENKDIVGTNGDPIADWYIFNVAGIFMFNSIKVNKFFSEKLNMADWSHMPTVNFRDYTLQNSGQYFIYKWYIPRNPKWGIFTRWGMGTWAGVTYKLNEEHALTVSGGAKSHIFKIVDEAGKVSTTSLTWSVFMAWDKNNTPLATLQLSGADDYTVLANVYPGVVRIKKFSPGLWAVAGKDGTGAFGICAKYTLGLGVGYGWR
jgi:hypothetical protein